MRPLLVALAVTLAAPAAAVPALVEDDFARALALARTQDRLLFVEAWAPW